MLFPLTLYVHTCLHTYVGVPLCRLSSSSHVLCDPMDCSPPGSPVDGILQAGTLEWTACPSPGAPSNPGIKCLSPVAPALAGGLFTSNSIFAFFTPEIILNPPGWQISKATTLWAYSGTGSPRRTTVTTEAGLEETPSAVVPTLTSCTAGRTPPSSRLKRKVNRQPSHYSAEPQREKRERWGQRKFNSSSDQDTGNMSPFNSLRYEFLIKYQVIVNNYQNLSCLLFQPTVLE